MCKIHIKVTLTMFKCVVTLLYIHVVVQASPSFIHKAFFPLAKTKAIPVKE